MHENKTNCASAYTYIKYNKKLYLYRVYTCIKNVIIIN